MRLQRTAVAALMVIVVAGACSDDSDSSGTVELPDEAAELVEDYYQTVAVEHDGDAMMELVTDSFEFVSGTDSIDKEAWAGEVNRLYENFTVDRLDDAVVVGGDGEYLVSQPEHVAGTGMDEDAFSVLRVVEDDDGWRIDMHVYISS